MMTSQKEIKMRAVDIDDAVLEASRIHREQARKADRKIKGERKGDAFYGTAYVAGRKVLVSVPNEER